MHHYYHAERDEDIIVEVKELGDGLCRLQIGDMFIYLTEKQLSKVEQAIPTTMVAAPRSLNLPSLEKEAGHERR